MSLSASFTTLAGDFALEIAIDAEDEVVVIYGRSGSGKTLTLRTIAGLTRPSPGQIAIGGRQVFDSSAGIDLPPQERRVGYVIQESTLFPHMNVEENVLVGVEGDGDARARWQTLRSVLSIEGLDERRPTEISGGQQQRVALARALVRDTEVLLLDEPFSALDFQTRLALADEVGGILRREGKTVILVTHDISEAVSMADRVVVMSKRPGHVKAEHAITFANAGAERPKPFEARNEPEFQDYFNQIWGELEIHVGG